jgi:hypothetical protein
MTNEDYNGWVNRETWCFNLWLSNEQALYARACEAAKLGLGKAQHMQREFPELTVKPDLFVGEAIMKMMTELYDEAIETCWQPDILRMFVEIGSCWRVDLREVGSAWVETAEEVDA